MSWEVAQQILPGRCRGLQIKRNTSIPFEVRVKEKKDSHERMKSDDWAESKKQTLYQQEVNKEQAKLYL